MSVIEIVIVIAAFTALLGAALVQNRERRESADYIAVESVLWGRDRAISLTGSNSGW